MPKNRNWLKSDFQQRRIFAGLTQRTKLRIKLYSGFVGLLLMLMLCVAVSTACHHLPQTPCVQPTLPSPPALSEPIPSVSYSEQARIRTQSWQRRLTDIPATSKQ